jgi:hypothetical protein
MSANASLATLAAFCIVSTYAFYRLALAWLTRRYGRSQ